MHPAAFWLDITVSPQDDEPRLRYASWPDERDEPLGEFIRLQCQLERMPLRHSLRLELETRERELEADHGERWLGGLARLTSWSVFRRGFPDEVAVSASDFLRHATSIFAAAPIQQLHLSGVRDKVTELANSPYLTKISYLDLSGNQIRDRGAQRLARSPFLTNLEGLNLSSTGLGDSGVRALVSSPYLGNLRELFLCDNRITRRGYRLLADSALVRQLDTLSIRANERVGTEPEVWEKDLAQVLRR